MKNIVIIGASGHARMIIDIIERQEDLKIIGLIDSYKTIGESLFNYKVIGTEDAIPDLIKSKTIVGGIIAIGDNYQRYQMFLKLSKTCVNFEYINAIHPSAIIGKDTHIGMGTVLMPYATVNANSKVGAHCIVNTQSSLGHDSIMENFSSLGPGSNTGGHVTIKTSSAICIGACITGGITIEKHSVVGAGSVVLKNINAFKLAYGNPTIEIRDREINESYF